jgi:hypothetical protein
MSRPALARLLCYVTLLVPFICADLAMILYVIGGFGGGHGRFDAWIGSLGCPANLLIMYGPLAPPFELHDLLLIVWYPAALNFMFCWGPIALVLHVCTRRWQSAWGTQQRASVSPRILIQESEQFDHWAQLVESK